MKKGVLVGKLVFKPKKEKMTGLFIVFAWIILWNLIYQALHGAGLWDNWSVGIENWSFFIAVTIFFMQEELTYRQRFWHTLIGGAVGLLIAAGVVLCCHMLMGFGLSHFTAISIPLIVAIGMLILLHPVIPAVFNNVGFCYFIISLIDSKGTVSALPDNLFSLLLGSICLNLGCIALLTLYKKHVKNKALAKATSNS